MKKTIFLLLTVLLLVSCEDMNHKKHATARLIKNAVEDIDGNKYDAVKIGNQIWMAENLKTTRYADGTEIPLRTLFGPVVPKEALRFYPDGNNNTVETYGYLYNWPAIMHNSPSSNANPSGIQGICPTGWHVPSQAEWQELINTVRSNDKYKCESCEDYIAKALASPTGWKSSSMFCAVGNNPKANNATHFSIVPAGSCLPASNSGFSDPFFDPVGHNAYFWTATGNNIFSLSYVKSSVRNSEKDSLYGYSVRCVKD